MAHEWLYWYIGGYLLGQIHGSGYFLMFRPNIFSKLYGKLCERPSAGPKE